MWIYIWWAKDYSAMRGPCPEGFHIPSRNEWQSLITLLTNAQIIGSSSPWWSGSYDVLKTALKLPMAGLRSNSSSSVDNIGSYGYYWSSTAYSAGNAYLLCFNSSSLNPQNGRYRAYGSTIRPFYDTTINPMDGEILKDGWEYLDWNPMMGNVCAWNPTLKVISVVYNWNQVITIADRNLWATTTYDWDIYEWWTEPTLSEANCWKFYQWWNNYGFPYSWSVTTSNTQVDASWYWPGNYYSSSTFITRSASPYDRSSVQNDNLWGGVTWVVSPAPLKNAYIGEYVREPGANTLAYYPLTSSTTVNDQSWNNRNLTNNWTSFGVYSGVDCAYFSNTQSKKLYWNLPLTWNKSFTISAWVNRSGVVTTEWSQIFLLWPINTSGYCLWVALSGGSFKYQYYTWGNDKVSDIVSQINTWEMVTVTNNTSTVSLYINGVLAKQWALTFNINTTDFTIWSWNVVRNGSYQPFYWLMSELLVESVVWTSDDIIRYHNKTKANYWL